MVRVVVKLLLPSIFVDRAGNRHGFEFTGAAPEPKEVAVGEFEILNSRGENICNGAITNNGQISLFPDKQSSCIGVVSQGNGRLALPAGL